MSVGAISGSGTSATSSNSTTTTTTLNPDGTTTTTVYNADGSVKSRTVSGSPKTDDKASSTSASLAEGTGTLLDVAA